jgi:hemoglobin/transferrin/lactoferrin receptor protein
MRMRGEERIMSKPASIITRFVVIVLTASFSLALSPSAGDLTGIVRDMKGGALSGAVVSAIDPQSGEVKKITIADDNGNYNFTALSPGSYNLRVECPGFQTVLRKNIEIAEGRDTRLDILLAALKDADKSEPQAKPEDQREAVRSANHEIVVTANKVEENSFESNRSVTVVNQKQLSEYAPRSTPEALLEAPGIFVQKTNNGGGTPYIRGMMGPQNLITVDGTRLNNSTYRSGPNQYLNIIDSLSLERIEVLRGSGSVLYGSDAMGGVINLMTVNRRDLPGTFGGQIISRYESADEGKVVHGASEIDLGNLKFSLGGTARDFSDLRGGGDTGRQPHSSYNQQGATLGLTYDFPKNFLPGWWISAKSFFNQINDAGRADQLYSGKKWLSYTNRDHLSYFRIHMPLTKLATYGEFTVSQQSFFERIDNFKTGNDFVTIVESATTRSDTDVSTLGFDMKFDTSLWSRFLHLRYGGMWYKDSVGSTNLNVFSRQTLVPPYPDNSSYATYGGYVMLDANPLASSSVHDLKLTTGLRWHGMSAYAPARAPISGTEQTLNPEEVNARYSGTVFFASAQYVARNAATFALTYSQGFRAPSLSEYVMFGDAGSYFQVPNPNLKPEKSDTFEFLTKLQLKKLPFLRNVSALESFDLDLTIYDSKIKDLLSRINTTWNGLTQVTPTTPIQMNINAIRGEVRGVELMAQIVLRSGFSLAANGTYTRADEEDAAGVKQPMRKIAPLFGLVRLRWDSPAASAVLKFLEVSVRAAGKQDRLNATDISDPRIPLGGTPGWWTLNFRTGLLIRKSLKITLALENILDKKYKYHGSGIWSPGRDFIVATEVLF